MLPATKLGGSTQYCVTSTGAVSYAAFDGDDGSYLLETTGSAEVKLGGPSAEFVALAAAVMANFNAIKTALGSAQAPAGTAGGPIIYGPGGALAYTDPTEVAASKVKAI